MSILRSSLDRCEPGSGPRVRWDEENLLFNDENRGDYDKIDEAPTPYMPPLDMKSIPDEDDHEDEDRNGSRRESDGETLYEKQMRFNEEVQARLMEVVDTKMIGGGDEMDDGIDDEGTLRDMDNESDGSDEFMERSDDYKDGIAFKSKRKDHYDMKNALSLGRQMMYDDEEEEEDDDDNGGHDEENVY